MSDYKMVPVVATEEMRDAAVSVSYDMTSDDAGTTYAAMLAAAPPFVVTDEMVEEALDAYHARNDYDAYSQRYAMRAAIKAALWGEK